MDHDSLPLVSIITPSFNQAGFLEETILSVLTQDYPRIEYLVIDGGSTDGSLDILKRYSDRLTYVSEPDRGQSHAINKGFRVARGEILAWLNSDDTYLPGAVSAAVAFMRVHPEVMMVYGEGYCITSEGNTIGRFPWTEPFDLWRLMYVSDYILQQTTFFRRSVLERVGFLDEGLHWGMDWDLWLRIGKCAKIAYLPTYMANLRQYLSTKTGSGGIARLNELVTIVRRHGSRRYPPAYFLYAWETLLKLVKKGIGYTPRPLSPSWLSLATGYVTGLTMHWSIRIQGMTRDGWAYRTSHRVLANPCQASSLVMAGSLPCEIIGINRSRPMIGIEINNYCIASVPVTSSSFRICVPLPPPLRTQSPLEITLRVNWSLPHRRNTSPLIPKGAAYHLDALEVC